MQRGAANTLKANAMHIYPRTWRRVKGFCRKKVERKITPNPKILNRRISFTVTT